MPYLNTADDTALFFRDWGHGDPVVFVHGWGLNSDMWEYQLPALADRGHRCIAYDRRGCGRSDQPGDGYDFDTLADDLAAVLEHLDLRDVTLVSHSMGSGRSPGTWHGTAPSGSRGSRSSARRCRICGWTRAIRGGRSGALR